MNASTLTFGLPNTLSPLTRRELRGCFVFGGMGLFVLLVGLFPELRPPPRFAPAIALAVLFFPAWALFRYLSCRRYRALPREDVSHNGTKTQAGLFALVMLAVGIGFFFWARGLGVAPTVILGTLLILEGLGGIIISLTEWWRLSHFGISFGLVCAGFILPFAGSGSPAVPVGGAFLFGSMCSAGILWAQLAHLRRSQV
jgi:hypothetical protein